MHLPSLSPAWQLRPSQISPLHLAEILLCSTHYSAPQLLWFGRVEGGHYIEGFKSKWVCVVLCESEELFTWKMSKHSIYRATSSPHCRFLFDILSYCYIETWESSVQLQYLSYFFILYCRCFVLRLKWKILYPSKAGSSPAVKTWFKSPEISWRMFRDLQLKVLHPPAARPVSSESHRCGKRCRQPA